MIRSVVVVGLLAVSVSSAAAGPRWCKGYKSEDQVFPEQVKSEFENYKTQKRAEFIPEAAALDCGKPNDQLTGEILAAWEKETGLAEADAIASLEARVSSSWATDHAAVCAALGTPDGKGQKLAIAQMHAKLLGCENSDRDDADWMSAADNRGEGVLPWLDAGIADRDELMRLGWVIGEVRHMLNPSESGPLLANYAVAQFDMKALDGDAAQKSVASLLKNSRYGRIVVMESVAWAKKEIARVEAAVAKKTADATWKSLIITVPQKGYADWNAAAAANKAMLAHSQKDCAVLKKDVTSLVKPINKGSIEEITGKLSENPIAGVVLARYAVCLGGGDDGDDKDDGDADDDAAADNDRLARNLVHAAEYFAVEVPEIAGPREAAFAATRNALAELKKKKPFDAWHDMSEPERPRFTRTGAGFSDMDKGVIASTKAVKKGTAVTFAHDKFKYTVVECKETSKIDRVDPDGKVQYRKACHDAGTAIGDNAPQPATVPPSCTSAVAKGRFVFIDEGIPWLVYADKSRKKILAAYCVPFE